MLTDLDMTLKQLLVRRVPLDLNEVEISFDCPKREWAAKVLKPTVNLYLFDLRENIELRRSGWAVERGQKGPSGLRRPPVLVDASYFITAWARNVADEHHLLWRVMATLMREPQIEQDVLHGALKEVGPPVKAVTAQADGVLRNPGEFWGALDNDLKPAVTYTATLALDLDLLLEAPLVLTKVVKLGLLEPSERRRLLAIGGTMRERAARRGGPAGPPLSGATLTFPHLGLDVQTDGEGRYVVADVPEGTHRVRILTGDGKVADVEVRVPAASYDLEI